MRWTLFFEEESTLGVAEPSRGNPVFEVFGTEDIGTITNPNSSWFVSREVPVL